MQKQWLCTSQGACASGRQARARRTYTSGRHACKCVVRNGSSIWAVRPSLFYYILRGVEARGP
eukprot:6196162-Pleurochrysis_carterae.AAC.4